MSYSHLSKFLWGYAIKITVYILNSILTKSIPNIPIELWTNRKASIQLYRTWGCPTYVFKLNTKSELCYFIGYSKGIK